MKSGQSAGPLQPQTSEGRHAEPAEFPVQSTQGAIEPQVVCAVPATHEPPLVQQ
jgi:hypothetical protein